MDILDAIINFFNVTDSTNLLKKNWTIFFDKNEYLGERIKAFFMYDSGGFAVYVFNDVMPFCGDGDCIYDTISM